MSNLSEFLFSKRRLILIMNMINEKHLTFKGIFDQRQAMVLYLVAL